MPENTTPAALPPETGDGPFFHHYLRDMVYAAHDGVVTTFAVVAGAQGAGLNSLAVLALGFANLAADGLSMGLGNYLGIKSERAAELKARYREGPETVHAARHGGVTWGTFMLAGLMPLLPYLSTLSRGTAWWTSLVCASLTLFGVGALRTKVTTRSWWQGGLEMLGIGLLAGGVAFLAGDLVRRIAGVG